MSGADPPCMLRCRLRALARSWSSCCRVLQIRFLKCEPVSFSNRQTSPSSLVLATSLASDSSPPDEAHPKVRIRPGTSRTVRDRIAIASNNPYDRVRNGTTGLTRPDERHYPEFPLDRVRQVQRIPEFPFQEFAVGVTRQRGIAEPDIAGHLVSGHMGLAEGAKLVRRE